MCRILIVDDNKEDVREPLVRQLGRIYGKDNLLESSNGKDALEVIDLHRPVLVIMDIMMPEMDGYTVIQNVRSNPKNTGIYIIILTGMEGGLAKSLEVGADMYLQKPLDLANITAAVARGLESVRLRRSVVTEQVTGFFTANFFREIIITEEVARSKRYDLPCSLIRISLLGNNLTEKDLKIIMTIFKGLRGSDRTAFFGTNDFAILLSTTIAENAVVVAKRLKMQIKSNQINQVCAIGISSFNVCQELLLPMAEDSLNGAKLDRSFAIYLNNEKVNGG